jgi:site-specific DNA-methyltransferase (adenine-specific)
MAVKKDKKRRRGVSQAKCETSGRIVLVGTYKGDQLTDWRGWYNYPISDSDFSRVEHVERVDGRARSPSAPQLPADYSCINELWLFKGTKDERRYKAEFVGIKTREELIRDYGYPAKGKAHGERYLLFKTQFMYRHKADTPEDAERVIVRAADFAKRSPKVAKQIKAYLESPDRNDPDLAKRLPEIITKLRPDQLRVCEAAVQLDFWLNTAVNDACQRVTPICVTQSSSISFRNEYGTLYLGDSLTWLKGLPTASVDLIFADPPYSIGKAEWDLFDSHEEYLSWCEAWIGECSRILTAKGTCYICGFSEILSDVKYRTQHFFNGCRWIIWHYRNKANLGSDWGRSHESLLHFRKERKTAINVDDIRIPYSAHTLKYPVHPQADSSAYGKGMSNSSIAQWRPNEKGAKPKDVFDIPTTCNGMGEKTPHPTQKPEELVRKLVLASSHEGDLVLDPFSGSGTTAVVAQQLHRRWLACDKNMEYNQWAIQRLEHVQDHPVRYWIEFDREVSKRRESIR